jgi:hypothetical protein
MSEQPERPEYQVQVPPRTISYRMSPVAFYGVIGGGGGALGWLVGKQSGHGTLGLLIGAGLGLGAGVAYRAAMDKIDGLRQERDALQNPPPSSREPVTYDDLGAPPDWMRRSSTPTTCKRADGSIFHVPPGQKCPQGSHVDWSTLMPMIS